MDEITKGRIEAARSEVAESHLPSARKDGLQRLLDHAERCANGTPDKVIAIAEALSDLLTHLTRQEAREPERIEQAVKASMPAPFTLRGAVGQITQSSPVLALIVFLWIAGKLGWDKALMFFGQ